MRAIVIFLPLAACMPRITGPILDTSKEEAEPFALTTLEPSSGPDGGGTAVRVTGTGFAEGATGAVGGTACASLTWLDEHELLCETPPGPVGEAQLAITQDGVTLALPFTYLDDGEDTGDTGTHDTGDTGTHDTGDTGTHETGDTGTPDTGRVPVNYCHLQWPCAMSGSHGRTSEAVYGWVYQPSVTPGVGAGAGLRLEVGVGGDGSDPLTARGWTWTPMVYNADKDGLTSGDLANDEYQGTFTLPKTAGSYDYTVRASADDGASWTLCDGGGESCPGNGSTDGYDPANAGALTVN